MAFTVRPIGADELDQWSTVLNTGFNRGPVEEVDLAFRRKYLNLERTCTAFDGSRMVGTAHSFSTPLTLPGGATIPVAAVTAVAVLPTDRRRGALHAMMRAQLDDIDVRGEAAAVLIAAEAPIYGRFGYGAATRHANEEIDTGRTRLATPVPDDMRLRPADRDEMRQVAPAVFDRYRAGRPGEIGRPEHRWDIDFGIIERSWMDDLKHRLYVIADGADGPEGYLVYKVEDRWAGRVPDAKATVLELTATSPAAYAALWDHLLRLDWVTRIEAADRPVDEPLSLLVTDSRRIRVAMVSDFLWARLLDVPSCLSARTYSVTDRLVLEVVDRFRPEAGGRFEVDGGPGGATSRAVDDEPDLVLDTGDLAGAWLGGASLWLPSVVGRVEERTPGALRRFDAMFVSQPPPFCGTWF